MSQSTFKAISKCTFVNSDFAIFDFYIIDEAEGNHLYIDSKSLTKTGNFTRLCEGNIIINKHLEVNSNYDIFHHNDYLNQFYDGAVERAVEICKERAKFLFSL